jgi:hypothetical protein
MGGFICSQTGNNVAGYSALIDDSETVGGSASSSSSISGSSVIGIV